jgi:beta-mannosidase
VVSGECGTLEGWLPLQQGTLHAAAFFPRSPTNLHQPPLLLLCLTCSGGQGIYSSFVMSTILEEDNSRPPWPSCPSPGWKSGVDTLWGLPNASPLGLVALSASSEDAGVLSPWGSSGLLPPPPFPASSSPAPPASTCTFVLNIDFANGYIGPDVPAATPQACCDACTANGTYCYVATFYQGGCWFKTQTQSLNISSFPGTSACIPAGRTIPPVPPPAPPVYPRETHGPYIEGNGWPTIVSSGTLSPFDPHLPPTLGLTVATGPQFPGTYASEFGATSMASFESMSGSLSQPNWGIHSPPMYQRNWAADDFIVTYFGKGAAIDRNASGTERAFAAQLYADLVAQSLRIKSDITERRSINSFGTIVWQFNEVWPTGGWGSVEYGPAPSPSPTTLGQVRGGRWKPSHYLYTRVLFRDQFAACGVDGRCFARNDDPLNGWSGTLTTSFLHLPTGAVLPVNATPIALPPGPAALQWSCLGSGDPYVTACESLASVLNRSACASDGTDCILLLSGTAEEAGAAAPVVDSFDLFAVPGALTLAPAALNVTAAVQPGQSGPDGAPYAISVTVQGGVGGGAALLVVLTTAASGRFTDNLLPVLVAGSETTVGFFPWEDFDPAVLAATLRVEHLGLYV